MNTQRPVPPVWILAVPTLTFGIMGGFVIVTLPQILAANGVPGGHIAVAVAVITSPGFWTFLLAPMLDVRFRRRTYGIVFTVLAAAAAAFTVWHHASQVEVEAVMLFGYLALFLSTGAVGGWVASLIQKHQDSALGAWTTAFNICGGGIGVLFTGYMVRNFSPSVAASVIFIALLVPMAVFPLIPAPPPDRTLAGESFRRFAHSVLALLRRGEVLVALAMFLLPSASFSLTNTLGGWGKDFHASPSLVSLFGGTGSIVAGIIGCSLVPLIAKKLSLRPMYLGIGLVGAAFTLSLLFMPRLPWTYGLAFVGENIFQSAAFATGLAIVFEVVGPGNPLASTTVSLLVAAMNLPVVYMEVIDGHGYDWHGVTGAYLTDALVSSAACILLVIVLRKWLFARREKAPQPA